jgi:hypothetical protein
MKVIGGDSQALPSGIALPGMWVVRISLCAIMIFHFYTGVYQPTDPDMLTQPYQVIGCLSGTRL